MKNARSFYAVTSPRGFANEITVTEYDNAQQAKADDGGFAQIARAKYIREYRNRRAQGTLECADYLQLLGVLGIAHIND